MKRYFHNGVQDVLMTLDVGQIANQTAKVTDWPTFQQVLFKPGRKKQQQKQINMVV